MLYGEQSYPDLSPVISTWPPVRRYPRHFGSIIWLSGWGILSKLIKRIDWLNDWLNGVLQHLVSVAFIFLTTDSHRLSHRFPQMVIQSFGCHSMVICSHSLWGDEVQVEEYWKNWILPYPPTLLSFSPLTARPRPGRAFIFFLAQRLLYHETLCALLLMLFTYLIIENNKL